MWGENSDFICSEKNYEPFSLMGKGWCRYGEQVLELLGRAEKSGRGREKELRKMTVKTSGQWGIPASTSRGHLVLI